MDPKRTIIAVSTIAVIALVVSLAAGAYSSPSSTPENFNIYLKIGWNLVSFAVVDNNTTPNHVFPDLTYNTDYFMYSWSAPGGPYAVQSPSVALKDNTGYWININRDYTVTTQYPTGPAGPRGYGFASYVVAAYNSIDNENANFVCDGVNDQVEINAAINSLPAIGGSIYLREGTYILSDNITISKSNVTLVGAGASTVLKIKGSKNADMFVISASGKVNLLIQNLRIDGNKANQSTGVMYGVLFASVENSKIIDCRIDNLRNSGIYLNSSSNNTIGGNTCTGNLHGIYLITSSNNTMTGNTCTGNSSNGIYLSGSSNNTVTGNTCSGNSTYGILLTNSSNNTVTGNTCSGNGYNGIYFDSSSNNTMTGNTCRANSYNGIELYNSSNNTVTGNTCRANSYYGIYFDSSSNNTMTGNTCTGNSSNGIELYNSSNNTMTGNTCTGNSSNGIILYSSSDNNTVTGNTCTGNDYNGSGIGIYSNYSSNNTVTGNTCRANSYGIYLDNSSNNTIASNTCQGNSYLGIYLYYNSSNNTMTGNTCTGNSTSGIYLYYNSSNNTMTGNTCTGNRYYGICLENSSNNTIGSNTVVGNSQWSNNALDGIYIQTNSDNNNIQGNTVRRGTGVNKQRYGMRIDDSTCDNNLVINNDLNQAGVTADYSNAGTGTIYHNNRTSAGWVA